MAQERTRTDAEVEVTATFRVPFSGAGRVEPTTIEAKVDKRIKALLADVEDLTLVYHLPKYDAPDPKAD